VNLTLAQAVNKRMLEGFMDCPVATAQQGSKDIHKSTTSSGERLDKVKKVKAVYSTSWETHLRATGRHLPYGITQCYLPPDTSERAPPLAGVNGRACKLKFLPQKNLSV